MITKKERLEKVIEVKKMIKQLRLDEGFGGIEELDKILKSYLDSEKHLKGTIELEEFNKLIKYNLPIDGRAPIIKIISK
jgi:succinate dehydrogenase flavin-adding protein (antitoxin of CptAB toxin-antitoxin module)